MIPCCDRHPGPGGERAAAVGAGVAASTPVGDGGEQPWAPRDITALLGVYEPSKLLRLAAERNELNVVADQVGGAGEAFPWSIHYVQGQLVVSWHGFAAEIMCQAVKLQLLERAPVLTPISTAAFPTPARPPANSRLGCSSAELELALPAWREDLLEFLLATIQPLLERGAP